MAELIELHPVKGEARVDSRIIAQWVGEPTRSRD
jgi:hypothetical protein